MDLEEEHPMDEPAQDEDDGPDDEKASDSASGKETAPTTEEDEPPATEEMEDFAAAAAEEDKEGEKKEETADEKNQEETAVPEAPATEGKDKSTEEEAAQGDGEKEAAEVEDVSEEAKRETSKLKSMFSGMRKSIKKKVKSMKEKKKSKSSGSDEEADESNVTQPTDSGGQNPAEEGSPEDKEETDSESGEREELIRKLRGTVLSLEDENMELKRSLQRMRAAANAERAEPFDERVSDDLVKDFESMTPDEKIKELDSQVQKWQKLYLESNEIGPSRIEKLEEGCDEATSIARSAGGSTQANSTTKDHKKNEKEDRILMLEYQLRESVKVLKTAQKKMVAQHEKEFHLQKTVDDLSDQNNELGGRVEMIKESEQRMKANWEQEEQEKLKAQAELARERQRLDDFREDLGLEPLHKNQQQPAVSDDRVEEQVQANSSSIFCWGGSAVQPISQ